MINTNQVIPKAHFKYFRSIYLICLGVSVGVDILHTSTYLDVKIDLFMDGVIAFWTRHSFVTANGRVQYALSKIIIGPKNMACSLTHHLIKNVLFLFFQDLYFAPCTDCLNFMNVSLTIKKKAVRKHVKKWLSQHAILELPSGVSSPILEVVSV